MIDQRLIRCILPKTYARRGFIDQDDRIELKVSVDQTNWVSLGQIDILAL